ncbi:MAG: hypothetical protein IT303_10535 [Dehalococcoidia bacterium]|nr:hypothetical protein [Dehalococcoidia bacterium]
MKTTRKTRLIALGVSGLLAVGVLGAGAAMAQEGSGPPPAGEAARHGHHPIRNGVATIIEVSGLDRAVFLEGFAAGKSINTILTENSLDPAAVQADALAAIDAKLDEAVASGQLTQAQADAAFARISEKLPELMDATPGDRPHPVLNLLRGMPQIAADTIGISLQELVQALRSGETVAEVATANGAEPQAVIDALVADSDAKIDQAVANGKLTEEQGENAKARAAEAIEKFVNEGRPERPERPGRLGEGRPGLRGR